MELGEEGLLEEDHWMLEVNLGNLETSLGEQEEYWLLAIKAVRAAATLKEVKGSIITANGRMNERRAFTFSLFKKTLWKQG
jgi:hypothetical protein